jgi:thioester reductase-like protein
MSSNFFITGGTGLVGTNLIPRILLKFPGSTLTLLVRGEDEDEAKARVTTIAHQVRAEFGIPDAADRIDGMLGDVNLDQCGLTTEQLRRYETYAGHCVHVP